ncbi:hypothetical protein [Spirosoma telluris]|uniref:hypothetical protein n=1 Tax=Spirosoma telluris TaxID=2183553 RepID=UPI002FC28031
MTSTAIKTLFHRFTSLKVGVIGDFAIDLYFTLQTKTSELSLETGLEVFGEDNPALFLVQRAMSFKIWWRWASPIFRQLAA